MTKTYTEQAIHIVERQLKVAKRDNSTASNRGLKFMPKGYIIMEGGRRIGTATAIQMIAAALEAEEAPAPAPDKRTGNPRRTGFTWDKLNQATQDFFMDLCERMQELTKDAGMTTPAMVKHLNIGLKNAPRLTNCKKAKLIETVSGIMKSHKYLVLTDDGRKIFLTLIGNS